MNVSMYVWIDLWDEDVVVFGLCELAFQLQFKMLLNFWKKDRRSKKSLDHIPRNWKPTQYICMLLFLKIIFSAVIKQ